jgi:SMI1 / KNR4 family (SUKH-1)
MPFLDNAKHLASQLGAIPAQSAHGCSEQEIAALEERLRRVFPAAYREFLLWTGRAAGDFWAGSHAFYSDLPDIQQWAVDLLRENSFPAELPPDALVFFMHQGYQFLFVRTSEGDDPPVYYYNETQPAQTFVRRAEHFSQFLEHALQT